MNKNTLKNEYKVILTTKIIVHFWKINVIKAKFI